MFAGGEGKDVRGLLLSGLRFVLSPLVCGRQFVVGTQASLEFSQPPIQLFNIVGRSVEIGFQFADLTASSKKVTVVVVLCRLLSVVEACRGLGRS